MLLTLLAALILLSAVGPGPSGARSTSYRGDKHGPAVEGRYGQHQEEPVGPGDQWAAYLEHQQVRRSAVQESLLAKAVQDWHFFSSVGARLNGPERSHGVRKLLRDKLNWLPNPYSALPLAIDTPTDEVQ
ncbi:hypothetical protein DPEC_G00323000 [Dallia pectoralis]|uniref:Uncharacterized protein n=1 Tax=Dallia pectoralis TaxID=75939 RepID=A0ACC2FAU8_DALPE|nr:hypothetical protein DPEC_G00323000 [Dallia pectoralis]